jgi:soluble lytic murein transglycosylase-like protein
MGNRGYVWLGVTGGALLLGMGLVWLLLAAALGVSVLLAGAEAPPPPLAPATEVMIILPYAGPDPAQLPQPSQDLPNPEGLQALVAAPLPGEPSAPAQRIAPEPATGGVLGPESLGDDLLEEAQFLADAGLAALIRAEIEERLAELAQSAPPPPAQEPANFRALFEGVGQRYGIDWRLLAALAYRESRLNPRALGGDGDMGLMQIIPTTWAAFAPVTVADIPFDPQANVEVAARYLLYLQAYLDRLGHGELYWVLVAYNWGPDNVRRLVQGGGEWHDVPARQQQYVADILEMAFGR